MKDIEKALSILHENHNCVFVKDDKVFVFDEKGIVPLIRALDSHENFEGYSCAYKIVGKAAAFIISKIKIKKLYAEIISKSAIDILVKQKISFTYKKSVEVLINRKGNDICPMGKVVKDIKDCDEAIKSIKIEELCNK